MKDTRAFLDFQYGTTVGYAWIGTDVNGTFTATKFDWPNEADEMVRAVKMADYEGDVWYSAHLSHNANSRAKGQSVERHRLHADIDRPLTSEDRQKIAQLEAWTVNSGSAGHVHVYVELDRSISVSEYEQLGEALVTYLDADKSKIRDNDLLRIAGTNNHKPAGGPVTIDRPYEKARAWSPERLAQILPVKAIEEKAAAITSGAIKPEGIDILPGNVARSLDNLSGDRSSDTYAVVCECAKAGLTLEQTTYVVLSQPTLKQRADEKGQQFMTNELHRIWAKAVKKASTTVNYADANDFTGLIEGWTPDSLATSPNPNILSAEKPPAPSEYKVRTASQMAKPRKMEWLAEGRIPKSATTILVGNEGIGKSLWWVHIVAIITNGWAAPYLGIPAGPKQHVMVVLNEDDWATAVAPRLIAAGVDLDYVHPVCSDDEGNDSPTFPNDGAMQVIEAGAAEFDVALIVVDTWMNSLRGVNLADSVKARNAIRPWNDLAQSHKTSVLLVTHTNRMTSKNTRDIMGGSSELRKAARSMIMAQHDEQKRLTFGVDKSNVAEAKNASIFQIVTADVEYEDGETGEMALLKYIGDADSTAQQIHENKVDATNDDVVEKKDCKVWLLDFLQSNGGSFLANDCLKVAKLAGFNDRAVRAARREIGAKLVRQTLGDISSPYLWSL